MVKLAVLALALFAGVASAASAGSRIVGGEETTIDQFPSIVQVESRDLNTGTWAHSCGASILNMLYILSAAHCFVGDIYQPVNRRIRAGTTYRNTGGILYYVERENNHPTYGLNDADGDISVIRLVSPIVYTPVIQRASIPTHGSVVPDNSPVVLAGWGFTEFGGAHSPVLQHTTVNVVNHAVCAERYRNAERVRTVTDNMICAGLLDIGGRDSCRSDCGGPLYYQGLIVGIISWGNGCGNGTYPRVSTRVSAYTNWVASVAV